MKFCSIGRVVSLGMLGRATTGIESEAKLSPKHAVNNEIDRRIGRHEQVTDVVVVEVHLQHTDRHRPTQPSIPSWSVNGDQLRSANKAKAATRERERERERSAEMLVNKCSD